MLSVDAKLEAAMLEELDLALRQLKQARGMSQRLLDSVPDSQWYGMPGGSRTHVAWQAAHLAVAEYRLALDRVRGRRDGDELLLPALAVERYGRGSTPSADPEANLSVDEIRAMLDRVHQRVLVESRDWGESLLAEPSLPEHPMFSTRIGALWWCATHESFHAGQIAHLRRLHGNDPLW
jgi:hypothetical protein